ncbi:hypothetical protein LTS18_001985, partial [Coniosporium uncinatum]
MVLRKTDVSFRYPTPVSPTKPASPKSKQKRASPTAPAVRPPTPVRKQIKQEQVTQHKEAVVLQTSKLDINQDSKIKQGSPLPPGPKVVIAAPSSGSIASGPHIIANPASSQRSEYQEFPELDARIAAGEDNPSKKRVREEQDILAGNIDQREKSNAALSNLQALIGDIFYAEDQIDPDTSGAVVVDKTGFFVLGSSGGD